MALWMTLLSGVLGTGLGGLLGVISPAIKDKTVARLMSVTAGLMLAIVCFELLPEAAMLSPLLAVVGVLAGMLSMLVSGLLIGGKGSTTTGFMVGAGIALHNFPEGLAVGAGYADAPALGFALCLTIALHDVPEGLAMTLPLRQGGMKSVKAVAMALCAGAPTLLGAIAGIVTGSVSEGALAVCLGLAGGAMLEITCVSLLPETQKAGGGLCESLLTALGILIGGAISYIL